MPTNTRESEPENPTAIFIKQFEQGSGNYTEEREELHKDINIYDIINRIKKREEPKGE